MITKADPYSVVDNYNTMHKRNCTVVALAAAADLSYDVAHAIAEAAGRKKNKGFNSAKLLKFFNKKQGSTQFRKVKRSTITVQKFCKNYSTGRYYVRKRGHAYAVVDGIVVDQTKPKPRERILEAWQFIGDTSKQSDVVITKNKSKITPDYVLVSRKDYDTILTEHESFLQHLYSTCHRSWSLGGIKFHNLNAEDRIALTTLLN